MEEGGTVDLRANATILLLNLAVDVGDKSSAAMLRHQLRMLSPRPSLAAEGYGAVSRQQATFGRFAEALQCARQMLAVAEEYRLNELIIRADRAIHDLERGIVPAVYEFRPKPVEEAEEQSIRSIEQGILMLCSA